MNKIADFVEWELQMFRDKCNFTERELEFFNLRAKGKSNIEISFAMHISESMVNKLARKVKTKMLKVL